MRKETIKPNKQLLKGYKLIGERKAKAAGGGAEGGDGDNPLSFCYY